MWSAGPLALHLLAPAANAWPGPSAWPLALFSGPPTCWLGPSGHSCSAPAQSPNLALRRQSLGLTVTQTWVSPPHCLMSLGSVPSSVTGGLYQPVSWWRGI